VLASDADTIHTANHDIDLMTLIPIYPEELAYKADHGLDALLDAFEEARIENVIDPSRVSAVPPRN
jgi:hypothetical protein